MKSKGIICFLILAAPIMIENAHAQDTQRAFSHKIPYHGYSTMMGATILQAGGQKL